MVPLFDPITKYIEDFCKTGDYIALLVSFFRIHVRQVKVN